MKVSLGNARRLCIGGWILGTLFILGHNLFNLTGLLDQPVLGYSKEIKIIHLRQGLLAQLGNLGVHEAGAYDLTDLDRMSAPPPVTSFVLQPETPGVAGQSRRGPELPRLTGILRIAYADGAELAFAVIEGRKLGEKDDVQGFTIERITPEGVLLSRGGSRWFVPAPANGFSVVRTDQGPVSSDPGGNQDGGSG